ncbi:MAG: trypsin-like peptidase domain-containing protein [Pirellulales bacterium]
MIRFRARLEWVALASAALVVLSHVPPAMGQEGTGVESVAAIEESIVGAIARAERSVVAIARVRRSENQPLDFSVNRFGRLQVTEQASPGMPEFIPNEYATGVVIDALGLILTAHHVLQQDCDYWITAPDRKIYKVTRIVGADPRSDLAVLQIEATGLVPIKFGDASTLKKGQFVIALGNPYAIARDGQASASWGIVANLTRKDGPLPDAGSQNANRALHQYGTLIQTDARLNLGTSGGALVNRKGEMVGLTVSLAAVTGYEQSAGFAIPVDEAFLRALKLLKKGSEVEFGFLGVGVDSLQPDERLKGRHGVRVQSVVPGTPASRFGLLDQDVITHVGGEEIYDRDQFMLSIGKLPAEASAILRVERSERPLVIVVDELAKYYVAGDKIVTGPRPAWRGIRVDHVTASQNFQTWSQRGQIDPQGSVLITEVDEGSPAWKEGLRPDMMISHVGGNRVTTPKQFLDQVSGKNGPVKLRLNLHTGDRPERVVPPDAG